MYTSLWHSSHTGAFPVGGLGSRRLLRSSVAGRPLHPGVLESRSPLKIIASLRPPTSAIDDSVTPSPTRNRSRL